MGELRGAKAEQALDVIGSHTVIGGDLLVFGYNRDPYDGRLRRLQIKVVGETPNIQMVRLDDQGKATSTRPSSPEELWLYNALQASEKVRDAMEGQHSALEVRLDEAHTRIQSLEDESTIWKTRLVEETARLREKLEALRAERDDLREQMERANETIDRQAEELDWTRGVANSAEEELAKANTQLDEINAALNELKPEKGNTNA